MKKNKKDRKKIFKLGVSLLLTVLVLTGSSFAWFTAFTSNGPDYEKYDTEGYITSKISTYQIIGSASIDVLYIRETGERYFNNLTLIPMSPTGNYRDWRSGNFQMKKQDTDIRTDWDSNNDSMDYDTTTVPGEYVDLFNDDNVLSWENYAEVDGNNGTFSFEIIDDSPRGQLAAFIEKDGHLYAPGDSIPEGDFKVYVYLDGSKDNSSARGASVRFKIEYGAVKYGY